MKTCFFRLSLPFLLLLCMTPLNAGEINRNGDFQFWLNQKLKQEISKDFDVYFQTELRYGDGASTLYLYYFQVGFEYALLDWLKIGPAFRQAYRLSSDRTFWIPVYVPTLDLILHKKWGDWEIANRNRGQWVRVDGGPNRWLYRNRTFINYSFEIKNVTLEPFVFDEVFFLEKEGFAQNRFSLGVFCTFLEHASIAPSYILRSQKGDRRWNHNHIFEILIKYNF